MDAIVVGGGIGGLTAAIALQRDGHRVRVFDQIPELRPVGAGISLWSNGVKVLNALGLGDALAAVGGVVDGVHYLDPKGATLCDFSLDPLFARVGQRPYPVRRADLHALLLEALGTDRVELATRITWVRDAGAGVVVGTDDGRDVEADLVVAADGAHSVLREYVVGRVVPRTYLGYHNWNGLVPGALGRSTDWTVYLGEGKRVSTMPVRGGYYFFFDVPRADPNVDPQEPVAAALRDAFVGWADAVQDLIDAADEPAVAHLAIASHDPIDCFARGRVAILGDAAHTTAPDLGQGGCQAMEDAFVLAIHLRANPDVAGALRDYSDERVPRTAAIMRRAVDRAHLTHGADPDRTAAWYAELADEDGSHIIDGICRTIESGPLG